MMANGPFLLCAILFVVVFPRSAPALNILYMQATGTIGSQFKTSLLMAETLVRRGHQVTFLMRDVSDDPTNTQILPKFVKFEFFRSQIGGSQLWRSMEALGAAALRGEHVSLFYKLYRKIRKGGFFPEECNAALSDHALMERLRAAKFDMVVGDVVFPCFVLIAQKLDLRHINVATGLVIPMEHSRPAGVPSHPAFVPGHLTRYTDDMNLFQRCMNLLAYGLNAFLADYFTLKPFDDLKVKYNIRPDMSLFESLGRAELWILNSGFVTYFPQAFTPNVVVVGGLTTTPAKPLETDFSAFVEGSGDSGVVIFALSSYFKQMDPALCNDIAAALARLPQRVLWKYEGEPPSTLGNNTMLYPWLPLNDLLGHPKTRLLITHSGISGVNEATYHGVPMVAIALFADHFLMANRIEKLGIAKQIDITTLTGETLYETTVEVLNNNRYKENAMKWSGIMRDQPIPPMERAVRWVEHVSKYGGDYLRPKSLDLNFFQLHCIDVLLVLAVVLFLGLLIAYYTLLMACRLICCRANKDGKFNIKKSE